VNAFRSIAWYYPYTDRDPDPNALNHPQVPTGKSMSAVDIPDPLASKPIVLELWYRGALVRAGADSPAVAAEGLKLAYLGIAPELPPVATTTTTTTTTTPQ
jgi:hypothetical protein